MLCNYFPQQDPLRNKQKLSTCDRGLKRFQPLRTWRPALVVFAYGAFLNFAVRSLRMRSVVFQGNDVYYSITDAA